MYADNVALPAFARPTLLQQSIGIFYAPADSIDPATARCCSGRMGQTDGRTDTVPLHSFCSAHYADSANPNPNSNNPKP